MFQKNTTLDNSHSKSLIQKIEQITPKNYYIIILLTITCLFYLPIWNNTLTEYDLSDFLMGYPYLALTIENVQYVFTNESHALTHFSHMLVYYFGQEVPFLHFFVNLVLHLLDTWLVFVFVKQLLQFYFNSNQSFWGALFASAAFALHPMHVEAIAWIMARKDVLYAFFYFLSLIIYIKYLKTKNYLWYGITFILFYFSLLSKGMAVPLSISLIAVDYYTKQDLKKIRVIIEKIPFLALSFYWGGGLGMISNLFKNEVVTGDSGGILSVKNTVMNYPLIERFVYACYGLCEYILRLIIPHKLSLVYPYPVNLRQEMPIEYWVFTIPIVLIFILFLYSLKKQKHLAFGIMFFIFNIILTLHLIIPVTTSLINDRYTYVCSVGLFFIIAYILIWIVERKPNLLIGIVSGMICYLLFYGIYTFQQVQVWQNDYTVWQNVVQHYPKAAQGWYGLGNWEYKSKNYQKAIDHYSQSIKVLPYYTDAFYNRANCYFELKDYQNALNDYDKAISMGPIKPFFYYNRGNTYFHLQNYAQAISNYDTLLQLNDNNSQGYFNRGIARLNLNQKSEGCYDFQKSLDLGFGNAKQMLQQHCQGVTPKRTINQTEQIMAKSPETNIDFYNQANVYFNQKNFKKAIEYYITSIELEPLLGAYYNLGNTYFYLQDYSKAIESYNHALRMNPNYADAYFNRGMAQLNLNQKDKACASFRDAQRLNYAPATAQIQTHCNE